MGFDYQSNIELAKSSLKLSMKDETNIEDLENLLKKFCLKDKSDSSDKSDNSDDSKDEMITRAPIGGEPVAFSDIYNGALRNGSTFDPNFCLLSCNSHTLDNKSKRSFDERELHAIKFKKPTEHSESLLQMQCSTIARFPSNDIIQNTHQTSGGIMTINPSPSTEEYDSSYSPGDHSYDSPLEDHQIVSPSSDYSSMASPGCNDPSLDAFVKKEIFNEDCQLVLDENKLNDVCEIIQEDLNKSRIIKEEKERLEKALSEDNYVASSPPQHVPQQGSIPSSSPPSLYNPELNDIIGDLLSSETSLLNQNHTPNQARFYSQQPPPPPPPPTTYAQPHQPIHVNSNHLQFTQQQPQIVTSPSHLQCSVQPQQPNIFNETPTQQHYPAQQILPTTGNQYVMPNTQVYSHSEQAVLNSSLLSYAQQNQQSATPTISNQCFTSQQQTQMMQNSKPYSLAFHSISSGQEHFPQAQPSQIITTTSNQHFTLPQHQNLATPKQQYTTSPSQQHVNVSQGQMAGGTIQATQSAIQQLTPVLQKVPNNHSVVTQKNSVVPLSSAPDQDGITTPVTSSNPAVLILTQPANPTKSFMLLPTTNIYFPTVTMAAKNKTLRNILPKPANSDPNGNQIDPKKLSSQAGKGRRDKDKSSKQCESPGEFFSIFLSSFHM